MGAKRSYAAMDSNQSTTDASAAAAAAQQSPFIPTFEHFRAELDEHHDRRERIIKASRDITAASKKIIFTLQRVRALAHPLPDRISASNKPFHTTIAGAYASIATDLQGINAHRYARNISGGHQEFIEAMTFQHYLSTGTLLSYEEARDAVRGQVLLKAAVEEEPGEEGRDVMGLDLSVEDYVLGVYDMTGELMRFAITSMATSGALPTSSPTSSRTLLTDLRALRAALEGLDARGGGPFARDVEKKAEVMRASVEKVERALYGLVVRGAERPKGWMPDMSEAGAVAGRGVEVEG